VKAGIYTRLSQDRPEETSRERQESDCRALAQLKGWDVVAVWTDLLSGYRRSVRRPGYAAALEAVASGQIDVLIVWKLDRLTRQGVREIARLLDALETGGVTLVSVQDSIDTSTAMGEGVLALLASVAKQESENTGTRVRSAGKARAAAGRPKRSGFRPYGYASDFVTVVPEEAELLREAARRILAGDSIYAVVSDWNSRGLKTTAGRPWNSTALRRPLLGARWRGLRAYDGVVVGPAQWPAVLDEETGAALDAVLAVRKRRRRVRSYMLTGIVKCGECGGPLTPRVRENGVRRYVCVKTPGSSEGRCGRVQVAAGGLEELVDRIMVAALSEGELLSSPDGPAGDLWAELGGLRARLERAEEAYVEGLLEKGRYKVLRASLIEQVEELEDRIGASLIVPAALDVEKGWPELDLEQRRTVVAAWFPRIVVNRAVKGGPRLDPGRIELEDVHGRKWRVSPAGPEDPESLVQVDGPGLLPL